MENKKRLYCTRCQVERLHIYQEYQHIYICTVCWKIIRIKR